MARKSFAEIAQDAQVAFNEASEKAKQAQEAYDANPNDDTKKALELFQADLKEAAENLEKAKANLDGKKSKAGSSDGLGDGDGAKNPPPSNENSEPVSLPYIASYASDGLEFRFGGNTKKIFFAGYENAEAYHKAVYDWMVECGYNGTREAVSGFLKSDDDAVRYISFNVGK